jgi:hypothetical protein
VESSFKKKYEKINEPDGSIVLKFKSQRIGAHFGSGIGAFLVLLLFPVSCAITSPVFVSSKTTASDSSVIWWIFASAVVWVLLTRFINFTTNTIKILPNSGIEFKGKKLPFADIQTIGTMNETTARNAKGTAYVYANSHGSQIKITNYVLLELAEAISSEIKKSSGISWR